VEFHQSRGELAVNAMVGIVFGAVTVALIYYVWTNGLPVKTETIPTSLT